LEVRGDDLDDLVLVARPALLDEGRSRELLGLALLLGQRVVCDLSYQVLEEPVLSSLRRAGIGLEGKHFFANQAGQQRLESLLREPGEEGEAGIVNGLPSTAPSWTNRRSSVESPSSRA